MPSEPPRIVLDVTRLLMRAGRSTPSGIDRVELAYAEYLMAHAPGRLRFAACHPVGVLGLLPSRPVRAVILSLVVQWSGTSPARWWLPILAWGLLLSAGLRPLYRLSATGPGGVVYLNVSHQSLDRTNAIARVGRRGVRIVCLVHDLIPVEWPEYVRPAAPARHRRRIETLTRCADGLIFGSAATRDAMQPWMDCAGREVETLVAKLGVGHAPVPARVLENSAPYFICLGTIEPRKNHLLLLQVWRRLVAISGASAPRLLLIGQRGWENENIVHLLERSPWPQSCVAEAAHLSDAEVGRLLGGARALLFPSFAEGYGLPLAEALALGVPALCSDLPALREVGGEVPEYLDPLDGTGWLRVVLEYAAPDSAARARQLARLATWSAPRWDSHMQQVVSWLDQPASGRTQPGPPAVHKTLMEVA